MDPGQGRASSVVWCAKPPQRPEPRLWPHGSRELLASRTAIAFFSASFPTCYGKEFASRALLNRAEQNEVVWHYIDPDKPQQDTPSKTRLHSVIQRQPP